MTITTIPVGAARIIQDRSREFRWYVKKDGTRTLQVACGWVEGSNGGFEWRDIPEVKEITE